MSEGELFTRLPVICNNVARPRNAQKELMKCLVGMFTTYLRARNAEDQEISVYFKRNLSIGFAK